MDNFSFLSKNKSTASMGSSKLYLRDSLLGQNNLNFQERLTHINCSCIHCVNNTKPIQEIECPRIASTDQYHKQDNEGYSFLITKMVDFIGAVKIPDTFIAADSTIIYQSNNSKFRIKAKQNLSLSEIKKYFDARRIQYCKIIKNQNYQITKIQKNQSKSFVSTENKSLKRPLTNQISSQSIKRQKQIKQIALINYFNSFSQLLTQSTLNKYLNKRKNDPFWQQITTISLVPPYKEDEPTYYKFMFERTQKNLKKINQEMYRVANILDQEDTFTNLASEFGSTNPETQNAFDKKLESKLKSEVYFNTIEVESSQKSLHENISLQKIQNDIAKLSIEIVAYFQVKLHIRISSCLFKYMIDYDGNYYFTGVEKFIAHNLQKSQLYFIHDRFSDLNINDSQEMSQLQTQIQTIEKNTLQNQLAGLIADCLQKRKSELSQITYKRLSNENLVKIFKKIFPNFNQEDVLQNKNWKNEFPAYISSCLKTINSIIREDQGIRILKRFGINFYRTWN